MNYQTIAYEKKDKVMIIRVNAAAEVERLSLELSEIGDNISAEKEAWVVILVGAAEGSFSIDPPGGGPPFSSLAESIAKLEVPVIAAIHGDAIGQGLELVLAADIRIAAETSRFGFPHIKKGLIPWDGGTQRLSRQVGRAKALEMILMGETIDAQEALRLGLLNRVLPATDLMNGAAEMAREMASMGPLALRYAKEAIHQGMDLTLDQGLRLEADLYFLLHTTRDRTEGIRAFQKKKAPQFEGR
jgi:enoyl-CoA hydratase/carnithine racemase